MSITWVAEDGTETQLLAGVPVGTTGRGVPPVRVLAGRQPNRSGSVFAGTLHDVRRISIPFELFQTAGVSDVRVGVRAWAKRLATMAGPGKLRCVTEVGDQREIEAWYVGGLQLVEVGNGAYQQATLEWDCPYPYWSDTADSTMSVTGTAPVSFFPLLTLSTSDLSSEVIADNTGDVESFPIIQITGPAVAPSVRNVTTNEVLSLSGSVGAGEVVTLDASIGAKTVLRQDGANLYSTLLDRGWFPLAKGQNVIRMSATGTNSSTVLSLRWRRKWLTV